MRDNNQQRIRTKQIERWFASEDVTVNNWCTRNHGGGFTFLRWLAVFRKKPKIFGASKHDSWIKIARQNRKNDVAPAALDKKTLTPQLRLPRIMKVKMVAQTYLSQLQ